MKSYDWRQSLFESQLFEVQKNNINILSCESHICFPSSKYSYTFGIVFVCLWVSSVLKTLTLISLYLNRAQPQPLTSRSSFHPPPPPPTGCSDWLLHVSSLSLCAAAVLPEGSAYEESVHTEGSVCESDVALCRQSEGLCLLSFNGFT